MCQPREQVREGSGISGLDDKSALVTRDQRCELPSVGGDDDHGPGHRGNAVELARNDEPFEFGLERYPVQVRHPERVVSPGPGRGGTESADRDEAAWPGARIP